MKTLYFDINGTLVVGDSTAPKPLLADGRFEAAVRDAGFVRLMCVSSLVRVVQTLHIAGRVRDRLEAIYGACGGVFSDLDWFRRSVVLGDHCHQRVRCIDLDGDWWYLDDFAEAYCEDAGHPGLFAHHAGGRVFAPEPTGDGGDILAWLQRVGGRIEA